MPELHSRRGSPDVFDFEGDGDEARDWLDTAYDTALRLRGPMGTVHHQRSERGGVSFDRLRIDAPVRFDADAMPVLVVVDVLGGEVEYTRRSVTDQASEGDTVLAAGWGMPFSGGGRGYDVRNTSISLEVLTDAIADIDPEKTSADLAFSSFVPRSAAAGAQWRAVVDQLSDLPDTPGDPGATAEAARLLANTLLHTFENNVVGDGSLPARDLHDATQSTVRRAQRLIEDRAEGELSLSDIAEACHVSPRSLQYAFRRHLGCTPHAYLRQVRLDLVHQGLRDGGAQSVGDVAARFGFFNPGRLAIEYRAVFGENPGQTLLRSTG